MKENFVPVRWGILGVSGHFIKRVLLPMQQSALTDLYSIASRTPEKAEQTARKYGIPHWHPSYEELLEDHSIEAVYIPLPNHMHVEWIERCADAGKHILCEKPLALNAEEADAAVNYALSRQVKIMEAFMYRLHPQWLRVRELIRTDTIGKLTLIHSIFTYLNKDPGNIRNILKLGGGSLRDIGCYPVSVARFLFEDEPVRAMTLIKRDEQFKTDKLTSGILEFKQGRALFTVGTQLFPEQRVDIYGTGGRITVPIPFNSYTDTPSVISVTTSQGSRTVHFDPCDQYGIEMEAFSKCIRTGEPVPISPEDAVYNQRVLDVLFKSEETGIWEKL